MPGLFTRDGGAILGFAQTTVNKQTVVHEVVFLEQGNWQDYFQYRVGNGVGEPPHKAFHCCFKFYIRNEPKGSPVLAAILDANTQAKRLTH